MSTDTTTDMTKPLDHCRIWMLIGALIVSMIGLAERILS